MRENFILWLLGVCALEGYANVGINERIFFGCLPNEKLLPQQNEGIVCDFLRSERPIPQKRVQNPPLEQKPQDSSEASKSDYAHLEIESKLSRLRSNSDSDSSIEFTLSRSSSDSEHGASSIESHSEPGNVDKFGTVNPLINSKNTESTAISSVLNSLQTSRVENGAPSPSANPSSVSLPKSVPVAIPDSEKPKPITVDNKDLQKSNSIYMESLG